LVKEPSKLATRFFIYNETRGKILEASLREEGRIQYQAQQGGKKKTAGQPSCKMSLNEPSHGGKSCGHIIIIAWKSGVYYKTSMAAAKGRSRDLDFRRALRRAYGAWEDNPSEDGVAIVRAMRDEWD
jgi:hypothetical protein